MYETKKKISLSLYFKLKKKGIKLNFNAKNERATQKRKRNEKVKQIKH